MIIDTNVLVVANKQNDDISDNCYYACIKVLNDAHRGRVIIDTQDAVFAEYRGAVSLGRPHNLGARFLIEIIQNQAVPSRVRQIEIEPHEEKGYTEFPDAPDLAGFDWSDRKFVALAIKSRVPITNAVDSDWIEYRTPLQNSGVAVNNICGADQCHWWAE